MKAKIIKETDWLWSIILFLAHILFLTIPSLKLEIHPIIQRLQWLKAEPQQKPVHNLSASQNDPGMSQQVVVHNNCTHNFKVYLTKSFYKLTISNSPYRFTRYNQNWIKGSVLNPIREYSIGLHRFHRETG